MKENLSADKKVQKKAEVYAIIDGIPIALPKKAKFICQDKRGCWFYCVRRPRVKDGDWTPNKEPIQILSKKNKITARVLITNSAKHWSETLQTTIKRNHLPMQL